MKCRGYQRVNALFTSKLPYAVQPQQKEQQVKKIRISLYISYLCMSEVLYIYLSQFVRSQFPSFKSLCDFFIFKFVTYSISIRLKFLIFVIRYLHYSLYPMFVMADIRYVRCSINLCCVIHVIPYIRYRYFQVRYISMSVLYNVCYV